MATTTLIGATSAPAAGAGTTKTRTQLQRDDFYKIMISELSNQDPFSPVDNKQFLDQMASLQSLDTTTKLADGIEKLLLQSQLGSASALIGRSVRGVGPSTDGASGEVTGVVEKVLVQGGDIRLQLKGGQSIAFAGVSEIA